MRPERTWDRPVTVGTTRETLWSAQLLTRCRADSAVECILMLDYLPTVIYPYPLLTFTLAYVGLCSLLSNLFTVDILLSLEE